MDGLFRFHCRTCGKRLKGTESQVGQKGKCPKCNTWFQVPDPNTATVQASREPDFDPYHVWLGIPKDEQPPTHYRLLGVSARETSSQVIDEAVIRQTTYLRTYQSGKHARVCARLLEEVAHAGRVLLDPAKREAYDAELADSVSTIGEPSDWISTSDVAAQAALPPEPADETLQVEPIALEKSVAKEPPPLRKRGRKRQTASSSAYLTLSIGGTMLLLIVASGMAWLMQSEDAVTKKEPVVVASVDGEFPTKFPLPIEESTLEAAFAQWELLAEQAVAQMTRIDSNGILKQRRYGSAGELQALLADETSRAQAESQGIIINLQNWLARINLVLAKSANAGLGNSSLFSALKERSTSARVTIGRLQMARSKINCQDTAARVELETLEQLEKLVASAETLDTNPNALDRAQELFDQSNPKLQQLCLLALVKAGRPKGLQAAVQVVECQSPADRLTADACLALMRFGKPSAIASAARRLASQPDLLGMLDPKALATAVETAPDAWHGLLMTLLGQTEQQVAEQALLVVCEAPQRDAEWAGQLFHCCTQGALKESLDLVVTSIIGAEWVEAYPTVPRILEAQPTLRIDELEPQQLSSCLAADQQVGTCLAAHFFSEGSETQLTWAAEAYASGKTRLDPADLRNRLKRELRLGPANVLGTLLSRPEAPALELAEWMLQDRTIDPLDIDINRIGSAAMERKPLRDTLLSLKWSSDAVGKAWALQQTLGEEVITALVAAEKQRGVHLTLVETMQVIWSNRLAGEIILTTRKQQAIAELRKTSQEETFRRSPERLDDLSKNLRDAKARDLGPILPAIDLLAQHVRLLIELGRLTQDFAAVTGRVADASTAGQGRHPVDEKVAAQLEQIEQRVQSLQKELQTNDAAVAEIVAMIPDFPQAAEVEAEAAGADTKRPFRIKYSCRKCKDTGIVECNCDDNGNRRCSCGDGKVAMPSYTSFVNPLTGAVINRKTKRYVTCSKCGGSGKIRCPFCNGTKQRVCPNCQGRSANRQPH